MLHHEQKPSQSLSGDVTSKNTDALDAPESNNTIKTFQMVIRISSEKLNVDNIMGNGTVAYSYEQTVANFKIKTLLAEAWRE